MVELEVCHLVGFLLLTKKKQDEYYLAKKVGKEIKKKFERKTYLSKKTNQYRL